MATSHTTYDGFDIWCENGNLTAICQTDRSVILEDYDPDGSSEYISGLIDGYWTRKYDEQDAADTAAVEQAA